jgi:5-methylthioribose kinase
MNPKEQFHEQYPDALFLENKPSQSLTNYLRSQHWISASESVRHTEKPGEGNMNFVMRVCTEQCSFIIKQSRPWVQKYPQVAAPIERITVEAAFYQAIRGQQVLQFYSPQLIGVDASNFILALEDLGSGADYSYLYQPDTKILDKEVEELTLYVSQLHTIKNIDFPVNDSMKALNHEHIFNYPFIENNGFDLNQVQEGLQELSLRYKTNTALKSKITAVGEQYLAISDTLIHGDFYPGSWLKVATGTKVIDPEFSFLGKAEFDLGVMIAHLKMAQQSDVLIAQIMTQYEKSSDFSEGMMWAFVGVEILRRLFGLAQLPLTLSLVEKEALANEAVAYLLA